MQLTSTKRTTPRIVRAMACLAIAIAISTSATAALAVDAWGPGVEKVNIRYSFIGDTLRDQYFVNKSNAVPQWTPDGGVFQYFSGAWGEGAIYWSADTGAHAMYGDILSYWRWRGYEPVLGYPYTEEIDSYDAGWCGPTSLREQHFRIGGTTTVTVCWNQNGAWEVWN
jgi:hypothetical protein